MIDNLETIFKALCWFSLIGVIASTFLGSVAGVLICGAAWLILEVWWGSYG